jgi:predicted RNA-binding Zn ribbon-like protein
VPRLPPAPPPLTWEPLRPFAFSGGNAALDFINTVDWTEQGLQSDRLTSYRRLLAWAAGAGVLRPAEAARLRRAAQKRAADAQAAVLRARAVRHLLAGLVRGLIGAPGLPSMATGPSALGAFNALLAQSHQHGVLVAARRRGSRSPRRRGLVAVPLGVQWPWQAQAADAADHRLLLESLLWPVVRLAASLLTSPEALAIRMCGGAECGWVFVDRSRGRRRRWCAMDTCGTVAKEARRRPRARSSRLAGDDDVSQAR